MESIIPLERPIQTVIIYDNGQVVHNHTTYEPMPESERAYGVTAQFEQEIRSNLDWAIKIDYTYSVEPINKTISKVRDLRMNKVILVGNVGQDPEVKTTTNGTTVVTFSLATSYGSGDNKKTEWHSLVAFDKTGQVIAENVKKGQKIAIEGHNRTRTWESEDGQKHWKTDVIVDSFEFCGPKPEKD